MVCIGTPNIDLLSSPPDAWSRLWLTVVRGLEHRDLDAHIAMFILRSSGGSSAPVLESLCRKLSAGTSNETNLPRSKDVAIAGVQLALNLPGSSLNEFEHAAHREIARQPLPPAACIHDDERLLIGVSAGIGAAARTLSSDLLRALRSRPQPQTIRQRCIDLWAESLGSGGFCFSTELAICAAEVIKQALNDPTSATPEDWVVLCWLACKLLESPWSPRREELEAVVEFGEGQSKGIRGLIASLGTITTVDAAFLLSLETFPLIRVAKTGVALVLEIIDGFSGSVAVFSRRQRKRRSFSIQDEYDLQDMFHAIVVPLIPDLSPEDPASKIAGKSSRLDFTSRSYRLGIELKHVKTKRRVSEIRDEILVDQRTYFQHPLIDSVITFVFDPCNFVPVDQRASFEADLSRTIKITERSINHIVRIR